MKAEKGGERDTPRTKKGDKDVWLLEEEAADTRLFVCPGKGECMFAVFHLHFC